MQGRTHDVNIQVVVDFCLLLRQTRQTRASRCEGEKTPSPRRDNRAKGSKVKDGQLQKRYRQLIKTIPLNLRHYQPYQVKVALLSAFSVGASKVFFFSTYRLPYAVRFLSRHRVFWPNILSISWIFRYFWRTGRQVKSVNQKMHPIKIWNRAPLNSLATSLAKPVIGAEAGDRIIAGLQNSTKWNDLSGGK